MRTGLALIILLALSPGQAFAQSKVPAPPCGGPVQVDCVWTLVYAKLGEQDTRSLWSESKSEEECVTELKSRPVGDAAYTCVHARKEWWPWGFSPRYPQNGWLPFVDHRWGYPTQEWCLIAYRGLEPIMCVPKYHGVDAPIVPWWRP